jgi:hypothetical protein
MEKLYYVAVAPNKEAAVHGGLTEAIEKCIDNDEEKSKDLYPGSFCRESLINSIRTEFEWALDRFDENNDCITDPYVVGTFNDISCKVELIYVCEITFKTFKHYYIRFEWL